MALCVNARTDPCVRLVDGGGGGVAQCNCGCSGVTKTDLSKLDDDTLEGMRVKELKKILTEFSEACEGCTEKRDFVNKVKKLVASQAGKSGERRTRFLLAFFALALVAHTAARRDRALSWRNSARPIEFLFVAAPCRACVPTFKLLC